MKASVYIAIARRLIDKGDNPDDVMRSVFVALMDEAIELGIKRSGTKNIPDRVMLPVVKELDLKWRAIAREFEWNPNFMKDLIASNGLKY